MSPQQPLSHFSPDLDISETYLTTDTRPEILADAAMIIAHWSSIECSLLRVTAAMLQADFTPLSAMIQALRGGTRAAMEAALEVLDDPGMPIFDRIMTKASAIEKERNKFAHRVWFGVKDRPEFLVLVRNRYVNKPAVASMANMSAVGDFVRLAAEGVSDEELRSFISAAHFAPPDQLTIDRSKAFVYTSADVEGYKREANWLRVVLSVCETMLAVEKIRGPSPAAWRPLLLTLLQIEAPQEDDLRDVLQVLQS